MKNMNDADGPDRKGADPKGIDAEGATEVFSSATGMFERPVAPPSQPEFDDPKALRPAAAAAPSAQTAAEKATPGEFTRLFQAITPSPEVSKEAAAASQTPLAGAVSGAPKTAAASDAKAGEFTRIFMRVPKEPESAPPLTMPAAAVSPQVADNSKVAGSEAGSETGEFTRLMRASAAESKVPPAVAASAVSPVAASTPVRGISAPGANDAVSGTAGVTEFFTGASQRSVAGSGSGPAATPTSARSGKGGPPNEPNWVSGPASFGQEQSAGEFTQLFRALDTNRESPEQAPGLEMPSRGAAPQMPQAGKVSDAAGGEFTQLMQSLSHERQGENRAAVPGQTPTTAASPATRAWPEPMTAQPPAVAADDSASFTRIISSSAAREEAARGTKSVADTPPAKGGASSSPIAPMAGMPQPLQMPIPRAASFGQPPAAAAPAPPVLPSPPPVSKLQAYLPLLLIVNGVVLAVLVVLVIIALHRH